MGKLDALHTALLAGGPLRLDGVTYYLHGGRVRVCQSKRGPKKSRSEAEIAATVRFTEMRKLWKVYRRAIGELPVWKVAAREAGKSKSDAFFHSLNDGCIEPGEGVRRFSTFCFSAGSLEMPDIIGVRREGHVVEMEWALAAERPKARKSDRVYVGYFYDTLPCSPGMVEVEGACRGDGKAVVTIPTLGQSEDTPLHLYLFFGSEESDRFSPSVYLAV